MNVFQLLGDILHLVSIIIILLKITKTKSCAGISLQSQAFYLIVFVTRYLDLFFKFISVYNSLMKVFFIVTSGVICYLMLFKYKATLQTTPDNFPGHYLLLPVVLIALVWPDDLLPVTKPLWRFSIILEAVAIFPQLYLMQSTGEAENITTHYLFALGGYRGMYILNWIYKFAVGQHPDTLAVIAGLVQTGLYADFFYIYVTKVLRGKKFELPT